MKKQLSILFLFTLLICTNKVAAQSASESDYVILQIVTPVRAGGELELIFYYGNGKSELFKKIEYSFKYIPELSNELVNAINYMSTKGYGLKTTGGFAGQQANTQYIFEKRSLNK